MGGVDRNAVRRMVELSCAAQGLPVKVSSPKVLGTVVVLLGALTVPVRTRSGESVRNRSQSPHRLHAGGIHHVNAWAAGLDDDVVQDRADDRSLPVEVERPPLAS
jgi:hypothetical protein